MTAIKVIQITFKKDGYIITTQNKMGLMSVWIEPQDVILIYKNYIIVLDDIAKYIEDVNHFYIPDSFTTEDIVETVDKLNEVRC